jgi:rod shape-determining protein MreC
MFSFLRRHRELLVVGTLLLWPMISFLSSGHRGRSSNVADRAVLFISTPIQFALTWILEGLGNGIAGYVSLRGAHEEAAVCRVSLSEAHAEVNSLREAQAENERLKSMLAYVEDSVEHEIVARVIGLNPSPQFQSIRINRGEDDGVKVGMPVVTPEGVVGQIVRSVGTSSDVMLITDPASRLGGLVQRTRVRAAVAGTGDGHQLSVDFVRREDDAKDGDAVVTAGSDGIFPPGVRIGTLQTSTRPSIGMFLKATLEPSVDFGRVEEVLIIPVTMGVSQSPTGKPLP